MPNNTISQVEVNGTTYDLLDMNTLSAVSAIERRVTALEDSVSTSPAVSHRNIYRGKNLGTSVTSAQWTAISNQTFDDLFVGDYWSISSTISGTTYNVTWRIWDIMYYYNYGDSAFTTPHLIVGPDAPLYNAKMNDSNTTTGGYRNSAMYKNNLATAIAIAENAFGSSHVKTHREYYNDSVTNGYPSQWNSSTNVWADTKKVELMTEDQVYGHPHFRPGTFYYTGTNTTIPANHSISQRQLAIFKLNPRYLNYTRMGYWLRDVVSSTNFVRLTNDGTTSGSGGASDSRGVRPLVIIG